MTAAIPAPRRRIFHACERHDPRPRDQRRLRQAWASWDELYANGSMIPCHCWKYPRDATSIGDSRALPFLKDVLLFAMNQAGPEDLIVLTNDDVWLHPAIASVLLFQTSVYECCSAQRVDFHQAVPSKMSPEKLAELGEGHLGRDLFAFTKRWLEFYWNGIGDFVLGCSEWDLCLSAMIRLHHGITTQRNNYAAVIFPAEIPRGYVCHQKHEAQWMHPDYVDRSPAQIHNRTLFREFGDKHLPRLKFLEGNVI